MNGIHRILCPIDFSELSHTAFEFACSLARAYQAHLLIMHVGTEPTVPPIGGVSILTPEEYEASLRESLKQYQTEAESASSETLVVLGQQAAERITSAARDNEADLIVMGTHGRSGISRALLGSVAEKVVRTAPCPVITLKAPMRQRGKLRFRTILHPTDLSEASSSAFQVACNLAKHHRARLIILYVESPGSRPDTWSRKDEIESELIECLRSHHLLKNGADVAYEVVHGSPGEMILDIADSHQADLIVMGTHGRTGLRRLAMGSVAEAINRKAKCPVLTIGGQTSSGPQLSNVLAASRGDTSVNVNDKPASSKAVPTPSDRLFGTLVTQAAQPDSAPHGPTIPEPTPGPNIPSEEPPELFPPPVTPFSIHDTPAKPLTPHPDLPEPDPTSVPPNHPGTALVNPHS